MDCNVIILNEAFKSIGKSFEIIAGSSLSFVMVYILFKTYSIFNKRK